MRQNKNLQQGFSIVEVLFVLLAIGVLVLLGWLALGRGGSVNNEEKQQQAAAKRTIDPSVVWDYDATGWHATFGTAPSCPQPYQLVAPADLTKATTVGYPGQTRQGLYASHGSLQLAGKTTVVSPIDGYIYRGLRVQTGSRVLYSFDIIDPCGVMVRLGGLEELTNKYQLVADKLPLAKAAVADLQKTEKGVIVRAGEKLGRATRLGVGVYDLRMPNASSNTTAGDRELTWYGVCWIDMLPSADAALIKALPSDDPTSGKQSDYCQT